MDHFIRLIAAILSMDGRLHEWDATFMLSINSYVASLQSDVDASFNRIEKCRNFARLICTARSLRESIYKSMINYVHEFINDFQRL